MMRVFSVACLLACLATHLPASALPKEGQDAFVRELRKIEGHERHRPPSSIRRELAALLDEHEGQLYVHYSGRRVCELLERCRFREEYQAPDLSELLRGEVEELDVEEGELHVRLRFPEEAQALGGSVAGLTGAPGDLVWEDNRWWFPVPFGGPGMLRLRGRVPENSEGAPDATVYAKLCLGEGNHFTTYELAAGERAQDDLAPVQVFLEELGTSELLEQNEQHLLAPGTEYFLELRVSRRRLFLRSEGKTVVSTPRPSKTYGRFGWVDLPGLEVLELEGEIDSEWLEDLPERHEQAAFEAWRKDASREIELPAWLQELSDSQPPGVNRVENKAVATVAALIDASDAAGALERMATLRHLPPWFRDWFSYRAHMLLNDRAQALQFLESVLERTPRHELSLSARERLLASMGTSKLGEYAQEERYAEGLQWLRENAEAPIDPYLRFLYEGIFHRGLNQTSEAIASLEQALEQRPQSAQVLALLGRLQWQRGDWQSAVRTLRSSPDESPGHRARLSSYLLVLDQLDEAVALLEDVTEPSFAWAHKALAKAQTAPAFQSPSRYEGRFCEVITRLTPRHARSAVEAFDETVDLVTALLGAHPAEESISRRLPCYLFLSPEAFMVYRHDVLELSSETVVGAYSHHGRQAIVQWRRASNSLPVVRHEAAHFASSIRFHDPPTWWDEGFACCMAEGHLEDGVPVLPSKRSERLSALHTGGFAWTPPSELLALSRDEFYAGGGRHYAQAEALVHWLLTGGVEERKWWDRLLLDLDEGRGDEAWRSALLEAYPDLDQRLRSHLESLGP